MEKPCDDSVIARMPVEILALIFLLVKDAMTGFKSESNVSTKARYCQPAQSPPLLVGAVCQRWRDSTLETPKLWTDIIVNLSKCGEGQFNMVEKWACRSGALPLDITIFDVNRVPFQPQPFDFWFQFKDVMWAIRSLANRWNDLALYVPECFSYHLLNNLQGTPPINSLFLNNMFQIVPCWDEKWEQKPFLQHPLLPRRFIYDFSQPSPIPIEWNRLVSLETAHIDHAELIHIIRHAQNLKHCAAFPQSRDDSIPTSRVTSHCLIYLKTNPETLRYLTLPSLLHLECQISQVFHIGGWNMGGRIESLIEFVHRSRAPLVNFIFRCGNISWTEIPEFSRLPEITSLSLEIVEYDLPDTSRIDNFFIALTRSLNPILPRLKEINVDLPYLPTLSWSLFSTLFWKDTGSISAPIDPISNTPIPLSNRQLSQGCVRLNDDFEVPMDEDTFLRLLEAKRSGVDLIIMDKEKDLFEHMAKLHDVSL